MKTEPRTRWLIELKATLRLAWPIVAGNIGQVLIGVVDTLMIGRVGVAELGAAAFVSNLFLIPLVASIGLLAAVPVLVAQAKGGGDAALAGRYLKHSFALTLAVALSATGLLGVNALFLDRYGQDEAVVAASHFYYLQIIVSLVPGLIYQCLKSFSEGLGWSNPPMYILLSGILLNIGLNWLWIFGHWGFPAMGLEGAGWATLAARSLVALGMLAFVLRAVRYRAYLPERWLSGYRWADYWRVLRLGLPTAAQHLFEVGAFAGAGVMIGWLSKEALAAHQVAISCAALAFMVPLGVSIATGIRVGSAFGGRDFASIGTICASGIAFTVGQTAVVALCFLVGGGWIASLFVEDPLVVRLAASIFVVVGLFQIFDGTQVACLGALRGMSDVNTPMLITFLAYWALAIPLGYALGFPFGLGAMGVWFGLAAGLFFAALCLLIRLRRMVRGAAS